MTSYQASSGIEPPCPGQFAVRQTCSRRSLISKRRVEKPSVVAIDALATLVALLRLDRQRGNRTGVETLEPDRLTGFLAESVGAVFDSLQGGVDLGNQLSLPIASA